MTVTAPSNYQEFNSSCHSGLLPQLKLGMHQLVQRHGLNLYLLERYEEAISQCLFSVFSESSSFAAKPETNQPWGWVPFLECADVKVGVLTVFRNCDIPLHDHPGSTGLLIVLRGRVRIESYQMAIDADLHGTQPLELEQTGDVELAEGQSNHFGPSENNIHSLQAIDDDCVLFDVLFCPYQPALRSYYLPVTEKSATGSLYVTRLRKPLSVAAS